MTGSPVQCSQCGMALPAGCLNQPELVPCPGCGAPSQAAVFPALFREAKSGAVGEVIQVDGEAACFFHANKKAVVPCAGCGRFLCALCDCDLNGQHLCPSCLETGKRKGKLKNLENHRTLHDRIALALAVYPLLIFYFTLLTAPIALFIAVRYWNAPTSILRRTKARFVAAIVLASLQLVGWGVGIYLAFAAFTSGS